MKKSTISAQGDTMISSEPKTIDSMSDTELDTKLQHSYAQSLSGEGRPMNEVFDALERNLK